MPRIPAHLAVTLAALDEQTVAAHEPVEMIDPFGLRSHTRPAKTDHPEE